MLDQGNQHDNSRAPTPYLDNSGSRNYHKEHEQHGKSRTVNRDANRKLKSISPVPHVSATLTRDRVPLWEDEDPGEGTNEPQYVAKGAFLLKNGPKETKFSSPKAVDQSQPAWLLGDGFSGDEGKPGYGLFGVVKRKRRRSRSRTRAGSRVGQLETELATQKSRKDSRLDFNRHINNKTKRRRGPAKDVWPTTKNFAEDIFVGETRSAKPDSRTVVPKTQKVEGLVHHSNNRGGGGGDVNPTAKRQRSFQYIPPQDKGSVDFENFRRVRGLQQGDARFLLSQIANYHPQRFKDSHVVLDSDDEDEEVSDEISATAFEIESKSRRSTSLGERDYIPVDDNNQEYRSTSVSSSRLSRATSRMPSQELHAGDSLKGDE